MEENQQQRVTRKLQEATAPPELAEQLCAIANEHGLTLRDVENWIQNRYAGREWTGESFRKWARQVATLRADLDTHASGKARTE